MKRKIIPVLIGCALSFSGLAAQPTAEHYVVSFPEGTRVPHGSRPPLQAGFAGLYKLLGLPVVPLALVGAYLHFVYEERFNENLLFDLVARPAPFSVSAPGLAA